jgi:protein AaeX
MTGELNIQGVYIPALLLLVIMAAIIGMAVQRVLMVLGAYRWIWHRGLFDLALTLIICLLLVSALSRGSLAFVLKPFV